MPIRTSIAVYTDSVLKSKRRSTLNTLSLEIYLQAILRKGRVCKRSPLVAITIVNDIVGREARKTTGRVPGSTERRDADAVGSTP